MLYLSYSFGPLQALVATAMHVEDMKALRALGNRMQRANEALQNWVRASKGDVVANLGSGGIVAVDPEKAVGVAGLVDRLTEFFGSTMHIGLGLTAPESWQALGQAERHGVPYVLFDPEDDEESLSKGEQPMQPGIEIDADAFEDPAFDPRHYMREALQQVKAQAPAFEQLKAQNPDAYKALQRVIAAMVLMGHEVAALQAKTPEEVQKAEDDTYKMLGLPKPKLNRVKRVKIPYTKPEAGGPNQSAPQNLDMERKSTTTDPTTGAPDKTKWHSLRSGQVVGRKGGIVPSRQPDQD